MTQQTLDANESGAYVGDGGTSNNAKINANFSEVYASEVKKASLTVDHEDVAAGAGAQSFDILTLTADIIVIASGVEGVEEWAGGTLSACTAAIGEDLGPDPDGYSEETDVFTGSGTGALVAAKGAQLVAATFQPVLVSGQKLQLTVTPTGDDLENATAGTTTGWVLYREA